MQSRGRIEGDGDGDEESEEIIIGKIEMKKIVIEAKNQL